MLSISAKDGSVLATAWKLKGMFQPDAITNFEINKTPYFVTEGDAREYTGFVDVKESVVLLLCLINSF
jgi:hypothetical protein